VGFAAVLVVQCSRRSRSGFALRSFNRYPMRGAGTDEEITIL
jgi:hypothetical protein